MPVNGESNGEEMEDEMGSCQELWGLGLLMLKTLP